MLGLRRRVVLAGGRRVRWRFGAGLALLAAVAVVAGVLVSTASSGSPASSGPAGGTSSGAAAVERRDLVQTDTESGTLSYADPQTVYDRLSGTITWLPGVGQVIKPGQPLFKVDGKPVTLMDGTTPAYRDLSPSDSAGQDILELNRNLVRLGFNPEGIVVDDTWQAATTAGVDVLQAYLGEAETGSLSLGQVVFLPGDQLVSTVDATLGGTGASSSPGSSANASDPVGAARPEFVSLPTRPSPGHHGNPGSEHKPGGQPNLKTLEALIALLRAEIAELQAQSHQPHTPSSPSSPHGAGPSSSNGGHPSSSGAGNPSSSSAGNPGSSSAGNPGSSGSGSPSSTGGGGSASAILHTTSTRLIVTVELDASKQSEAKVGEPVTVELPGGNAVNGKITAVSPVAQSSSGNGNGNGGNGNGGNGNGNGSNNSSGSVIPVTIALSGQHLGAGLDQASVSVNFAQAKASNVLSVPVTALLATAGGGYAVQAAAAPHALIRVTTGLFAAGYVQISGPGIYQGLEVTDSQG